MKYKYKYIGAKFIEENERLERLFENQAKKGWMLEKTGILFFKFKKTNPQQLKFFIDYNRPIDDYIYSMEQCGYHYIDNYKILNIFYSYDLNIEPIQSDPIVKAMSRKELCKPWSIILFFILGLMIYGLSDLFDLSKIFFRTIDHIILNFKSFLAYLLFKLLAISLIFNSITMLVFRIKCNRIIKGLYTPAIITQSIIYIHYFMDGFSLLYCIVILIIFSIGDVTILISCILFLAICILLNHYINKEIIKIESKLKRALFSIIAIILFIGTHSIISDTFSSKIISDENSTAYQSDIYNYSDTQHELFYVSSIHYGTSNDKDEFDEYIQTYRETIYQCKNKAIAKSIFRALIRDTDYYSRIPSDEEIDRITDEKGSFSSYEDVPYYSYQKSIQNLKQHHYKNVDICYSYKNNYIAIKNNIVYDLSVKEGTDIEKLIDFYK